MSGFDLGHGVIARPFRSSDAAAVFAAVDAERERLAEWMPWVWTSTTLDDSRRFVEDAGTRLDDGTAVHWGLFEGERVVGAVGAGIDSLNRVSELGYWIASDKEGLGLVARAMRALITDLFERGLHRLVIHAATGNDRSVALAERLGFTYEGTEREALRMGEKVHDAVVYGLLRREWNR
ncbi:MAG TPA: GNAT family protein [Acidimicrobiia bacterium]|nr:GNAT family protein [Acidimicrobiia bacterium]